MDPATATLIASGINAGANLFSQIHTNRQNRQSELDARAFNIRQQEIMNQFNSPVQQVQRLRAAGLNPALAYGGNGELVGNQSAPVVGNPVVNQAPQADFGGVISNYVAVREQENRNMLAKSETALQSAQSFASWASGMNSLAERKKTLDLLNPMILQINSETQKLVNEAQESLQRIEESKKRMEVSDEQINLIRAQFNLTEQQANRIIQLLPHEIQQMNSASYLNWCNSSACLAGIQQAWQRLAIDKEQCAIMAGQLGVSEETLAETVRHNQTIEQAQKTSIWTNFATRLLGIGAGLVAGFAAGGPVGAVAGGFVGSSFSSTNYPNATP